MSSLSTALNMIALSGLLVCAALSQYHRIDFDGCVIIETGSFHTAWHPGDI